MPQKKLFNYSPLSKKRKIFTSPFLLSLRLFPGQPGKSETYLEAIRKNIEWLKKHSKEEGKDGEKHSHSRG